MGICLMLSQVCAILIFFGFVLVIKGPEAIPYMMDDPDFEKVYMNSFDYTKEEYGRICRWIRDSFSDHGVDPGRIKETFYTISYQNGYYSAMERGWRDDPAKNPGTYRRR